MPRKSSNPNQEPNPKPPKNPKAKLSSTPSAESESVPETPVKPLDDLRAEMTAPAAPVEAAKNKGGRPSNADREKGMTAIVETAIELPFAVSRMLTNWPGFKLNPDLRPQIIELAKQVYRDFGPELANKWITLILFSVLYGSAFIGTWREFFAVKKAEKQAAEQAKAAANKDTEKSDGKSGKKTAE